ncbi:Ppx/GppA phosphatase family protein [Methanoregula sp.]|uniref:Ppx/GppA phosphatase family protein n=1 Tax=Methanoregula sp. TaxID=2052170 RepID=UPI0026021FCD|nr:Ppx/GppA phosphatase family protein [Methanoregula sp.]MDD5141858.1 Ppx/GppA phosphatase family protein [Methanoregula sp.]
MSEGEIGPEGRVVTFIDLGTNSFRMLIVRINANHSYTILSRQKQQVRLGEGAFEDEEITPPAMDRAVIVAKKFVDLACTFHTEEFVAVATSATREATNQNELLHRLRQEAGLDIRIISGREEARLIYLGVAGTVNPANRTIFCIDIGGGSTEIAVGDARGYHHLDSFPIGAIRLANLYPCPDERGIITPAQQKQIHQHARDAIGPVLVPVRSLKPDCAIGSSGTIMNLAEIAGKALHSGSVPLQGSNGQTLKYKELKKVIELLSSMTLEQRRRVPGINPDRADIIVPGAIILEVFMKELGLSEISVTNRSLQDGLLADYLSRMDTFPLMGELTPRQRSVLQLGRSCGINEVHARTVTMLVLEMFDSAKTKKLHDFSDAERELLEYAAFLHDIGSFLSFTNHHAHSYYIIRNSELLGFNEREVNLIAMLARFHRKKSPRKKDSFVTDLDPRDQRALLLLSCFLRLGESLDRSHAALVQHVRFSAAGKNTARLEIQARGECQLEMWGIENEKRAFEKAFGRNIIFSVVETTPS